MFKNVKIIVLYQNIGGHKGVKILLTLKQRVGGIVPEKPVYLALKLGSYLLSQGMASPCTTRYLACLIRA
jgi:hypothetical protein